MIPDQIDRRCVCTSRHLQVQGKYTKGSATYTDKLADAIALDFAAWIFAERRTLKEDAEVSSKGLESLAINDVAVSGKWTVDCAWNFRKDSHINILEESSLLRLAQRCANLKYPTRITAMVDSNVVRGASSKGRSSSLGLSTVLKRFNAVCVAAALYFSIPFCPTRHNPSDDPTRDTPLRCTLPGLDFLKMDRDSQFDLCSLPKLRRWTSNWARLILRLSGSQLLHLSRRDLFRRSFTSNWFSQSKTFDSTLGFPGEGPLIPSLLWIFLMWICSILLPFELVCLCLLWPLGFRCSDISHLLDHPGTYVEEINAVLCRYGRLLYEAGKTYNQYAETINSLTSMRPSLRRQMQGAWDLGYAWMRLEPSQHHIAMPAAILISMVTTSLLWGWTHFAGCIALAWGSLLRPGELFTLKRANLLFPADTGNTISYLLISLMEPKTRFTTARHQSTRLDIPDLLKLVTMPHFPLWPFSPQTFRNRFRSVLAALDLPTEHTRNLKCLDPGSLRAGGATWLMQTTDNGELMRRRGRWQNHRIMEVYIQEVSSLLYLQKLPKSTRDKIIEVAQFFNEVVEKAVVFLEAGIPLNAWFILFQR